MELWKSRAQHREAVGAVLGVWMRNTWAATWETKPCARPTASRMRENQQGPDCGLLLFLNHTLEEIICTFVPSNLTMLHTFKMYFPCPFWPWSSIWRSPCVRPLSISPSVTQLLTEFAWADLFPLRRRLLPSYSLLPQALKTGNLASHVVTDCDPAGDSFTTTKGTGSPWWHLHWDCAWVPWAELLAGPSPLFWAQPRPQKVCPRPASTAHVPANVVSLAPPLCAMYPEAEHFKNT